MKPTAQKINLNDLNQMYNIQVPVHASYQLYSYTFYTTLTIMVSLWLQKDGHLAVLICSIGRAGTFTACVVVFFPPSTNGHLVRSIAGVCGGGTHHLYFVGGRENSSRACVPARKKDLFESPISIHFFQSFELVHITFK